MHLLITQELRRAEHRLHDEVGRDLTRQAEQDARLDHRLGEQREVGRPRPRDCRDRVHVRLGHLNDAADVLEHLLRLGQVAVVRVRTRAETRHPLVHGGRRVRHRAQYRDAVRKMPLDLLRRHRGRDREHRLFGRDLRPDLAQQGFEILGLHGDDDEGRVRDSVRVGQRRLDLVAIRQFVEPLLAPAGDDDLRRLAPARAEQPGKERFADLASTEDRECAGLVDMG